MNHKTLSEGIPMVFGAVYSFVPSAQFGSDVGKTILFAAIGWGTGRLLNMAAAWYRKRRNEKAAK